MNARFPKAEHLCSRRLIERLHAEGHRLTVFPYSITWYVEPELPVPCQVLIVAPKRRLRHAVDRNRIKRLTRECYRLNKHHLVPFLLQHNLHITLSLVYIHNDRLTFAQLQHKFEKLMSLLTKDILAYEETMESSEVANQ